MGYRSCAGPSDRIGRAAQLETYNGLPFLPCIAGIASPSIYHTRIPTDPHSINIVRLHYPSRVADRGSQQDIFLPININLTRGCCAVTALQSSLQCYVTEQDYTTQSAAAVPHSATSLEAALLFYAGLIQFKLNSAPFLLGFHRNPSCLRLGWEVEETLK